MASSFTFQLRRDRANKRGECPLCINKKTGDDKLFKSTGISVLPKHWDITKQQIKSNHPQSIELNLLLNKFRAEYDEVATAVRLTTKKTVTANDLKRGIKQTNLGKMTFIEFYKYNVSELSKTVSADRIKSYNTTLKALERYAKHIRTKLDFDSIDLDFYNSFRDYMEDVLSFKPNTVASRIKDLKATLNNAVELGYTINTAHRGKKFITPSEEVDNIYLTENELENIFNLDLSNNARLDKARDIFLVGCCTGLRFGDFTNIKNEYLQGEFIDFKETAKTGQAVVIYINKMLRSIIEKYKGITENSLPPAIANQKLNAYIKEVGALAGINDSIEMSATKGKLSTTKTTPKYQLISTHTARRSWATNQYLNGVPTITIMAVTGHRTESSFMKYIKVTPREHAEIIKRMQEDRDRQLMYAV